MRISFWLVLSLICGYAAVAQQNQYELSVQEESLGQVIQLLETDLGLLFSYKKKDIQHLKKDFHIQAQKNDYTLILEQLLQNTKLTYKIIDKQYIVIQKKEAPEKTSICGIVKDEESQQNLPYAHVIIKDKTTGTFTNDKGYFELSAAFFEKDSIQISYVGYDRQWFHYSQFMDKTCPTIILSYPKIKEAFLVVSDYLTDGVTVEHNGASTDIKPRLCGNLAGSVEPDIMSTIQFLPGISNPSSKASDMYIRGCKPDQNLMIWENIPIYHTAHYFGTISAFNPYIIENIKVYKGGFNASYGGRIGGVIDLASANEKSYNQYLGLAADMTHTKAYLHQMLNFKKPTSVTLSIRRSFNELWETPTFKILSKYNQQGLVLEDEDLAFLTGDNNKRINIDNDFYFMDAYGKVSSSINENNQVEVAGFLVQNRFNDVISDLDRGLEQTDSLYLKNYGFSLKWKHRWNKKWETILKGVRSNYAVDYDFKIDIDQINDPLLLGKKQNQIDDAQFCLINRYTINETQQVELGYHLTHNHVSYGVLDKRYHMENGIDYVTQDKHSLHTLYAHYQNPIKNKIGVQAGLRATYHTRFQKTYLEPRIRLDYQINNALSLHGSYGKHHQFLSQVTTYLGDDNAFNVPIWVFAGDSSIAIQKAELYQFGTMYQANSWVIDVQAYYRSISGLSSRSFTIENLEGERPKTGTAKAKGLDFLIKKRFGKLRSWLSYSMSQVDLSFKGRDLGTFPTDYQQRHVFNLSNQLRLNNWEIALAYEISSGLPYTAVTDHKIEKPDRLPPELPMPPPNIAYTYGSINELYLPSMQQVNLSVQYQLKPASKPWKAYAGISFQNLFNQQNIYNQYETFIPIRPGEEKSKIVEQYNLPFTPNFSVRVEW